MYAHSDLDFGRAKMGFTGDGPRNLQVACEDQRLIT
jgi:hypothetical protein